MTLVAAPVEAICLITGQPHAELPPIEPEQILWRPNPVYRKSIGDDLRDPNHVIRHYPNGPRVFLDKEALADHIARADLQLARLRQHNIRIPTYDHGPIVPSDEPDMPPNFVIHSRVDNIQGHIPILYNPNHTRYLADFYASYVGYLMTAPEGEVVLYDMPYEEQLRLGQPAPKDVPLQPNDTDILWGIDIGAALTTATYEPDARYMHTLKHCIGRLRVLAESSETAELALEQSKEFYRAAAA